MFDRRECRRVVVAGGRASPHHVEDQIFLSAVVVLAVDVLALADTNVAGGVNRIRAGPGAGIQQNVQIAIAVQDFVKIVAGRNTGE